MTYQEILEGITRHRANRITVADPSFGSDLQRKIDELEWALQALAEKMAETEKI